MGNPSTKRQRKRYRRRRSDTTQFSKGVNHYEVCERFSEHAARERGEYTEEEVVGYEFWQSLRDVWVEFDLPYIATLLGVLVASGVTSAVLIFVLFSDW